MKKRIFISMHYMEIGGAEMALVGLLQSMDYTKYDVDLFLHAHRGEMMRFIPKEVNLLPEIRKYRMLEESIMLCLKGGCYDLAICRILSKLMRKIYFYFHKNEKDDDGYFRSYMTTWLLPNINAGTDYDMAISFLTPHNIVLQKVTALKKIAWIHTDYSTLKLTCNLVKPVWEKYDHIVSISKDVTNTFVDIFPSLSNKIIEMENILSPEFVRKRSEEFQVEFNENEFRALKARLGARASMNLNPNLNPNKSSNDNFPLTAKRSPLNVNYVNLLSVGRFCEAKNYDNVPDICSRIISKLSSDSKHYTLNSKLSIRWYIIGWGGDEELIRRKIEEAGMQDHVIILGKKSNPYPYIKACDIYVQPSRYEGKSVTVREAQMLCKPVVVTNYPTAKSQIQDGIDGRIVPMDNEDCAQGLAEFILNKELQKQVTEYLKTHDYGNEAEVKKIDLLFE